MHFFGCCWFFFLSVCWNMDFVNKKHLVSYLQYPYYTFLAYAFSPHPPRSLRFIVQHVTWLPFALHKIQATAIHCFCWFQVLLTKWNQKKETKWNETKMNAQHMTIISEHLRHHDYEIYSNFSTWFSVQMVFLLLSNLGFLFVVIVCWFLRTFLFLLEENSNKFSFEYNFTLAAAAAAAAVVVADDYLLK